MGKFNGPRSDFSQFFLHCFSFLLGQYALELEPVLPTVAKVRILDTNHRQTTIHKWQCPRGPNQRGVKLNKEDEARKTSSVKTEARSPRSKLLHG